jgi:heat shock protein HslJ
MANEPSWSLDIDFDKFMRFKSLTELSELSTPPGKEAKAQDADVTSYRAQTEAGMLIVTILRGPCTDTMSGEIFPLKVRVDAKYTADTDYKQFEGCGRYVVDYRLNDIWVLTTFNDKKLKTEDFVKGLLVVEFHLNENRVFGSTGCNRMTGSFEAKGKKITLGKMATTRMACPSMDFEQQFLAAVTENTLDYFIDAGILTLQDDKGMVLVFEKTD